jgi:hypothetical protein
VATVVVVVVVVVDRARRRQASGIDATPVLRVEGFGHYGAPGGWRVRWRVTNERAWAVRIVSAIQPHSQFRTEETAVERDLAGHASTDIDLPVRFGETPGAVIENPFLILRIAVGDAEWRVLSRVRVMAGPRGEPIAGNTIATSTNRIGAV